MAESRARAASSRASSNGSKVRGVDIRPLHTDRGPDEMAKNLFRLLYCLGVKCTDVCQITVSKYEGVASVHVRTAECENYLVAIFQDPASIMNQYDLRRITRGPRKLRVTRLSTHGQSSQETPVLPNSKDNTPVLGNNIKAEKSNHHTTGERQHKVVTNPPNDREKLMSDPAKHQKELSQAAESPTTSLSYSQYGFEQLESEEDIPKKMCHLSNAATSTTDFSMLVRDKRGHQHDKERTAQRPTNGSPVGVERKDYSQNPDSSAQVNNENQVPYKAAEVKINKGCICKSQVIYLNSSNLINIPVESEESQNETLTEFTEQHTSGPTRRSHDAPKSEKTPPIEGSHQDVIKLHAKTSTPAVPPCGCPETVFYHLQQHIGAETRHAEFKRGGIVREQGLFRSVVGKYVCGFLNSEGGTIYFGVSDDGEVLGIRVDAAMEETLREDVDFAVRSLLEPSVDPSQYSVNFARVMEPGGQLSEDLRVMELCVKPRRPPKRGRFSCGDVVYIRRDGSLQATARTTGSSQEQRARAHGQRRA